MSDKTSDKNKQSINSSDKLLNCPFCGGEAMTYKIKSLMLHDLRYGVMCKDTPFCCTMSGYNTEEEAIKAWNTRKPMERIIERLERLKGKDFISSEDYEGNVEFHFYGHTSEHDEMIRFAIEIAKEEGGIE